MMQCYFATEVGFSKTDLSNSPSVAATTTEQAASPVILIIVLIISSILSTPAIITIPSIGRPTACNTIPSIIIPAPGTPAVPIEANVAVKIIVSCAETGKSIP